MWNTFSASQCIALRLQADTLEIHFSVRIRKTCESDLCPDSDACFSISFIYLKCLTMK